MENKVEDITARLLDTEHLRRWFLELWAYIVTPWSLYQLVLIIASFALAVYLSRKVEPKLEAWARTIKTNPHMLRIIIAVMRRMEWLFFIAAMGLSVVILRAMTWPSRSYLVVVVLKLATAWLLIAVASRIIRSRPMSRLFAMVVWTYFALSVFGYTNAVANYLDSVAYTLGDFRISLFLVLNAVFFISVALWLAVTVGNFVDHRVQRIEDITPSFKVLIGKFVKIGLIIIAVLASLSAVGIDLTAFAVFSGAVGVGLGFGLQKVVSNFISGIIILLDKSIKPGDTITLGDTFGWIRELRARFVSVITRDGREFLIPNEDFITQQVVNWSFTDDLVRLDVHFGVSYDSNPHEVIDVAKEAAGKLDRVLTTRAPVCWMTGFGDSSIDFVLRFWIRDPQGGLTNIRGQVLIGLWDSFKENGIQFPFPHREIIMRTPVDVQMVEPVQEKPKPSAPDSERVRR